MQKRSLYDRLGGAYPIALVVNKFSDSLITNRIVGAGSDNPDLDHWHSEEYLTRLPGLKFMRTLWLCSLSGGPFVYSGKSLKDAHFHLHIKPFEFDAVAEALSNALDYYNVPMREHDEVMAAFVAQKSDVTAGSRKGLEERTLVLECPFGKR